MAAGFLSEDWFSAGRAAMDGLTCAGGLDASVRFRIDEPDGGPTWTLTVAGGRVEEWGPGTSGDADLECEMSLADAWAVLAGAVDGTEALGRVRVRAGDTSGPPELPSPMDLGLQPALDDMPAIPGADLDVQYRYSAGPWGPVAFGLSFRDGRVASMVLGEVERPDVEAGCTFLQMAQVRRGDIGILDALADGGWVDGSEGALGLLAGFSESPELRRAEVGCGPSGRVLGILGQYHEGVLGPALREVARHTEVPSEGG